MDETSKLIDEYAALDDAITKMKPHIARHAALRDQLFRCAAGTPAASEAVTIENDHYVLAWSPQEKQRRIVDMGKVKKRLGMALFTRLVTMTLKALDTHITKAEQAELGLTVTEPTGPRTCKVIAKLAPVVKSVP